MDAKELNKRIIALARRLEKSKNFYGVDTLGPFVTFRHGKLVYAFRLMLESSFKKAMFSLYCVNTDDTIKTLSYEDIDLRKVKQMIETYEKSKGGVKQ